MTFEHHEVDIGEAVKTFGIEFWKFYHKGPFLQKKHKNCSQNFQVLRRPAAITTQWLQIAGNLCPYYNWDKMF